MSLISTAMTECIPVTETAIPDGRGGNRSAWTEGQTHFYAAIVFDSSIQARVAEAQGVSSKYTVTTARSKTLNYHDVFKRKSDNKIFRVTSDGDDKVTPESAGLDMRQVTAEEWVLPS